MFIIIMLNSKFIQYAKMSHCIAFYSKPLVLVISWLAVKQCVTCFPASINGEFVKKREENPVVGDFAEILVKKVNSAVLM